MILNKKNYYILFFIIIILYLIFCIFYYINFLKIQSNPISNYKSYIISKTEDAFRLQISGLGIGENTNNRIIRGISEDVYIAMIEGNIKQNFSNRNQCFFKSKKYNPLKMYIQNDISGTKQIVLNFKFQGSSGKLNVESCLNHINDLIERTNKNIEESILQDVGRIIYFKVVKKKLDQLKENEEVADYERLMLRVDSSFQLNMRDVDSKFKIKVENLKNYLAVKKDANASTSKDVVMDKLLSDLILLSLEIDIQDRYITKVLEIVDEINYKLKFLKEYKVDSKIGYTQLQNLYDNRSSEEQKRFINFKTYKITEQGYSPKKSSSYLTLIVLVSIIILMLLALLNFIYVKKINLSQEIKNLF